MGPRVNAEPRVSKSHLQISDGEISLPPCLVLPSHHNKKEVSHLAGLWAWGLCYRNPRDTHTRTRTHTRTLLTNQINLTPIA